jgi:formamidopyrimidine-DNA glycosylase
MPEITEVLVTSHYLLSKIKNRYIKSIKVLSGRYTHQDLVGKDLIKKNSPLKIKNIDTKGKVLWFELESENKTLYMICNFGLTGEWSFEKKQNARLKIKIINKNSDKKYSLYFMDDRNFGIITITDDKKVLDDKLNKLSRDYIKEPFSNKEFNDAIINFINEKKNNKNKILVKFLMDQDKGDTVGSGIGNYIAAETMYEAKLSPYRTIGSLTKKEIERLNESIKKVMKISYISNKIGYMERLQDYIDKHKEQVKKGKYPDYFPEIKIKDSDEFVFKVYQQDEDPNGNPVTADKIITGRTTYWCPSIQK